MKASEEAAETAEKETHSHKVGTLNVGIMTGRGRDLEDMMEQKKAGVFVPTENKVER